MLVRSVTAVVVAITDPSRADTAAVVARELFAVARAVGARAHAGTRLVAAVPTVVLAVAVPPRRDAPVRRRAREII